MAWKTLDDMDLTGKRVLVRVDINVPMEDGHVTDTTRIDRIVPTVRDVLAAGGIPILMAHYGRPKGKVVPEMSLSHVVPTLSDILDQPVAFIDGNYGDRIAALQAGDIALLENLRFNPGEEANDANFAQRLASLGDVYVNDAFSAAHRAHASTEALAKLLPACAGRLMQEELSALEAALGTPERPVVAIVGGAKVSTKLDLLGNLVEKVDHLVIGGGMANTFLAAQGIDVGKSLAEHEMANTARDIIAKAKTTGCEIILPRDIVVAKEFKENAQHRTVAAGACPEDQMILDAGPETVDYIKGVLKDAKTLIMNGPLGVFELAPFHKATFDVLDEIARQTKAGDLVSVAGGGDTVAAVNASGHESDFTYISTAGGAFLEWMEGKTLPGVAALEG
ncbi:phosphoglycerate kinase [Litoreibacter ascidiaceicola]|uniref:Phosphoglycerate kinase n=1 Tax=Litoreibacter ascidiaceicola TaxID=1486859 RepID=A0A1M4SR24_9RHOB|nr:phosphoglycerate kinase [Litoreibacter ascidiaceicola]SHE34703.1 phosphoglycerate kinase [Litoreibacter ascidiaceicola]